MSDFHIRAKRCGLEEAVTIIEQPGSAITEFSQDEIDLMIAALELWKARMAWEAAEGSKPNVGHRWAGDFVASRVAALVNKLRAW